MSMRRPVRSGWTGPWGTWPAVATLGLMLAACGAGAAEEAEEPTGLRVCGDLYFGLSNQGGTARRLTDGQWAAVGSNDPSVLGLSWKSGASSEALLTWGVGDMYVGRDRTVRQPVECWYSMSAGGGSLTLGKHYTPFGLQEWEYETRWGALYEREVSGGRLAVSWAHNRDTQAGNAMARFELPMGKETKLGVSAAAGRGWSYGTSHSWGWGVDAETSLEAVALKGEFLEARGRNGTFQFAFLRVETPATPRITPYVAAYYGHDRADEEGELRSVTAGAECRVYPWLTVEPGVGRTGGRNVWWLQANVTF